MSVLDICLDVLRPQLPGVDVNTWNPHIEFRTYPILHLRRLGGRHSDDRSQITFPVIEITAYTDDMLETSEALLDSALDMLDEAQRVQTVTPHGWLHSMFTTFEAGQFDAQFEGAFRMQALVQLGARIIK